jgi:hypothetical protein
MELPRYLALTLFWCNGGYSSAVCFGFNNIRAMTSGATKLFEFDLAGTGPIWIPFLGLDEAFEPISEGFLGSQLAPKSSQNQIISNLTAGDSKTHTRPPRTVSWKQRGSFHPGEKSKVVAHLNIGRTGSDGKARSWLLLIGTNSGRTSRCLSDEKNRVEQRCSCAFPSFLVGIQGRAALNRARGPYIACRNS